MELKKTFLILIAILFAITTVNAQISSWIQDFGNEEDEVSNNIVCDDEGNMYITGAFNSSDLTIGSTTLTNTGGWDVFTAKFDPSGSPVWAVSSHGPNANEYGNDITVDEEGNVYVIGTFETAAVSFDGGTDWLDLSGNTDLFVVKYDNSGAYMWSVTNSTGGEGYEYGNGIDYFASAIHIIGSFDSDNLGLDGIALSSAGGFDAFWGTLNPSGAIVTAQNAMGSEDDYGKDIAVNNTGEIAMTGYFLSPTIDFGGGLFFMNGTGTHEIFVTKMSGGTYWGKVPAGMTGNDRGRGVEIDDAGNVYVTGDFESSVLSIAGLALLNHNTWGTSNYFIAKYFLDGSGMSDWARTAPSNYDESWNFSDVGKDLAVDNSGNVYATGWYNSNRINFGLGVIQNATNNNYSEIFVGKYSSTGTLQWLAEGHAVYNSRGTGIDLYGDECPAAVTGWFESENVPFAGGMLRNAGPEETSDFYLANICPYNCVAQCGDNMAVLDSVHTGLEGIGYDDSKWDIIGGESGGSYPMAAVGTQWYTSDWSYGPPLPGTNWISIDEMPDADEGEYTFETKFSLMDCANPVLNLCIMVDDIAEVYLNGHMIGTANSINTPSHISASGYPPFVSGTNVLQIKVTNLNDYQMGLNVKGYICCDYNPCDDLTINYVNDTTSECCYDVFFANTNPAQTINSITLSTTTGASTIQGVTLPGGWTCTGCPPPNTNSLTLNPNNPGSFLTGINLCLVSGEANPQLISLEWLGWDENQDTLRCYDTLVLKCPDTSSCQACTNPIHGISTGPGAGGSADSDWTLVSAPAGIATGPAVCVSPVPGGWGSPLSGTDWISFSSSGGGMMSSAPTGDYLYKTQFCICDSCGQDESVSLKMCIQVDDTARVYLNGTASSNMIGMATTPMSPATITYGGSLFNVGGMNQLYVKVTNDPTYYTGFDAQVWICCEKTSGISGSLSNESITIYPNPASERVVIESPVRINRIEFYNQLGEVIKTREVNDSAINMNTQSLIQGIYLVRITTSQGIVSKRLLIRK